MQGPTIVGLRRERVKANGELSPLIQSWLAGGWHCSISDAYDVSELL